MSLPAPLIVFRCDASMTIGTGHIRRCTSLAEALRLLGARCLFVVRQTDIDVATSLRAQEFECLMLQAATGPDIRETEPDGTSHASWLGTSQTQDANDTLSVMTRADLPRPAWLITDHYSLDARWHAQARAALGCRIAAIDDLGDRPLDVELLIDHNLHADHHRKYGPHITAKTQILGGPRFALLGPAYAELSPVEVRETVGSIGIFMGGVDSADLTSLALRACRESAAFTGPIEMVVTSASPHLQSLRTLARSYPNTQLSIDLPDLTEFFTRHDLHIGAGGGATWERCCAGTPMLLLQAAANQHTVVQELAATGAANTLTDGEDATVASIGTAVTKLLSDQPYRRSLAERARALVDGLGARRVAASLTADNLLLRHARADDMDRSFAWRNDASTRQYSLNSSEINLIDHRKWWQDSLLQPNRRIFIACIGSLDVGVLRLDFSGAQAEVSIYLDPAMTGLGLGPRLLAAAQQWVREHTGAERLVAKILPSNRASMRAFRSAGFASGEPHWVWPVSPSRTPATGPTP